jgi:methyl-accepting chemotaxis protein
MDKLTQGNAASAEESSSVAAELSAQSRQLADLVSSFRLEGGGEDRPAARPGGWKRLNGAAGQRARA